MSSATFFLLCLAAASGEAGEENPTDRESYTARAERCVDLLMRHGTDRYGEVRMPILVSILDVESRDCPRDPLALDEAWRVTRRGRRNPAGANLLTDQPLLHSMRRLSAVTGREEYEEFARRYARCYLQNLTDEKGFVWWGWHRHYDVFRDVKDGHSGSPHEIHAIHCIDWDLLWQADPAATEREIEAIWKWHVIDKKTGEINRHGDGQRGCDFIMSAGACIEAFTFLWEKTEDAVWLERAKLLCDYYWRRRNEATDLVPDRPNAGTDRFDGGCFVTSVTGLYCHSLLEAFERTGEDVFKNQAVAYLKAYAKHGYDPETGKFWGALKLDGTPIPGPRVVGGYGQYEPRGHLDLWEPYVAGYQYAIYTAQAYAHGAQLTGDAELLRTAMRFADWIRRSPPSAGCLRDTWYRGYATDYAPQGAHAGKYGRAVSFLVHLYALTGERDYLASARSLADEAIEKLEHGGLFRGHPAKPYYEAMDGVGYLLFALVTLDEAARDRPSALRRGLDNW